MNKELLQRLLEKIQRYQVKRQDHDTFADEIKDIEAELAKPDQEPVGYVTRILRKAPSFRAGI